MKKLSILASLAAATLCCSCAFLKNKDSVEYYAFRSGSEGKWGMISPKGDVLFEDEFKTRPTDVIGGVFFVKNNDRKWEIYEVGGKNTTTLSPDTYISILPFYEDVTLAVREGNPITIIDKFGKEIAVLEKAGGEYIYSAQPFSCGLSVVSTKSGLGAVNTKGELVIRAKYNKLTNFNDGIAIGLENKYKDEDKENRVYSFIDPTGNSLFTLKGSKYDMNYSKASFKDGLMPVCKRDGREQRWGFINKKGEEVVKPTGKNAGIGDWCSSCYVFYDGNQCGLKSIADNEVLIRSKYDVLAFATEDASLLWAGDGRNHNNMKWTLINKNGDVVSQDTYKSVSPFNGNYCPLKVSDNEWVFINKSGEEQKLKTDIYEIGGTEFDKLIYSGVVRKKLSNFYDFDNIAPENINEYLSYFEDAFESTVENTETEVVEEVTEVVEEVTEENENTETGNGYTNRYDGNIGKASVTMTLTFVGDIISGSYYYGSGKNGSIALSGFIDVNKISMTETTSAGKNTGLFEGILDGRSIYGTFTNLSTGKKSKFSLNEE